MRGGDRVILPLPPGAGATPGLVSLVGAGPGDPELITVRGLRRLRRADTVVFDRLVARELLDEAPAAERIYCGKEPGRATLEQEEINTLLVALARSGRRVVRLKGGDPFVFGRGGEEAAALEAAGVDWEVVPGLTSAIAVPALAGIPVTYRGVASSFTVATALGAGGAPTSAARWGHRSETPPTDRADSLVLLMGASRLGSFTAELLAAGRDPATPAAVIERGSLPEERVIVGTLADVAGLAARADVTAPAVLVVGEVVRLRERLAGRRAVPGDTAVRPATPSPCRHPTRRLAR